ncbi:uncharacterized protein KIAA0513 [Uranotaenia lowii]|uniref:uncharacterized protein KIAA0513 n=1 Tax=Uranotaenia lowii TaxID=190385 RepID=UPI00247AC869|nr:uncharacterized protein KIAA0513 [Uranotaenia lowii]
MDIAAFASTMAAKASAQSARDRVSQPANDLASGETSGSNHEGTSSRMHHRMPPSHVHPHPHPATNPAQANKLKSFMGRTPSAIKSKFLSVLGNSTEIINGISNKIDAALSLSSSEETETTEGRLQAKVDNMLRQKYEAAQWKQPDDRSESQEIDFELRRAKQRRAQEEVLSGRYRNPAFSHPTSNGSPAQPVPIADGPPSNSISTEFSHSNYSNNSCSIDSKSPLPAAGEEEDDDQWPGEVVPSSGTPAAESPIPSAAPAPMNSGIAVAISMATTETFGTIAPVKDFIREPKLGMPSSASTSDNESCILSAATLESSEQKMWIRSESENSVPSWASSISLDSQSEEAILDFMKRFIEILFRDSSSITLELKSDFGQYARTESGRLWFSRLVNAQRAKSKLVDESTFYSLIQYFAIVLFECNESEDYSPAKTLMNMCFTFYHDIAVPGCAPYREYLYTYLRDQPIWHSLRFWNAAFFDALQTERKHRPVPPTKVISSTTTGNSQQQPNKDSHGHHHRKDDGTGKNTLVVPENELSSSTSACDRTDPFELQEDKKYHQNLSFGQLGSFTCNMHAFGLSRELCHEFLMKQCVIANLNSEQQRLLIDNVNRMYRETDPWREN